MSIALEHNGRKIFTCYDCPPIPLRCFDWVAIFENYDGAPDSRCPVGRGATEREAVADLIEQAEEQG